MSAGVVVLAHGAPANRADIPQYLARVMHGRTPTQLQIDDLIRRYDAIGGESPLLANTLAQADGIHQELQRRGVIVADVTVGMKFSTPTIAAAIQQLQSHGATSIVGIVMAPQYSRLAIAPYVDQCNLAGAEYGLPVTVVHGWYRAPGFAELLEDNIRVALEAYGSGADKVAILCTAHSLPLVAVTADDPYVQQVNDLSTMITGPYRGRDYGAWQSTPRGVSNWIGPALPRAFQTIRDNGFSDVVIVPIGFVADHLEILYDIDIEAHQFATEYGLGVRRTAMPNADPRFIEILANLVEGVIRP